jgi:hypothetical protein
VLKTGTSFNWVFFFRSLELFVEFIAEGCTAVRFNIIYDPVWISMQADPASLHSHFPWKNSCQISISVLDTADDISIHH